MSDSAAIDPTAPPSGTGCAECEATGSWWLHLRRCAACGHIGCCDDSLNRHGTAHYRETGHPVEQSFEPGEDWFWDFRSEEYAEGPRLADPQSHPAAQSVPGPPDRVPQNWVAILDRRAGAE
jgi:hypothetical protein